MGDVTPGRPTWSCGHPVSPHPTTEEALLHIGHAIELNRAELQRHERHGK